MCTHYTQALALSRSSAKAVDGWFPLTSASVYYDHAVHAPDDHTVNVDFLNAERGPSARLAVELSRDAARNLAQAILAAVAEADRFEESQGP